MREVVEAAKEHGAVIRVGVNSGSLQRDLREYGAADPAGALVESAVRYCALLEELGFTRIKVSAKSSSPLVTIAANRLLAQSGALSAAPGRDRGRHPLGGLDPQRGRPGDPAGRRA